MNPERPSSVVRGRSSPARHVAPLKARTEAQTIRSAQQLARAGHEVHVFEKHAKAAGLDAHADYVQISGGTSQNDALLSKSIQVAGGGIDESEYLPTRRGSDVRLESGTRTSAGQRLAAKKARRSSEDDDL